MWTLSPNNVRVTSCFDLVVARLPEWIPGISGFKACTRKTRVLNYSIENELFEKTKNQIVRHFFSYWFSVVACVQTRSLFPLRCHVIQAAGTPPPSLLADALHKNNQELPVVIRD